MRGKVVSEMHDGFERVREQGNKPETTAGKFWLIVGFAWMCVSFLSSAHAQWMTQTISLQPGWNAVYLEVQPEPGWCDDIFTNTPVESVWKWSRRFSTIQYELDPNEPIVATPHWRVWFAPDTPHHFAGRLTLLEGCQAYLIHLPTNEAPYTWSIKGRVMMPLPDWYPHELNLTGLAVSSNDAPTFSDYFAYTPEVDTSKGLLNKLYTIDHRGHATIIVQPARVSPAPGAAYWIECARAPQSPSALAVAPEPANAIDFGSTRMQQTLTIGNQQSSASMTITVRHRASEPPPVDAGRPELAGSVPLSCNELNESNVWVWQDFPTMGLTFTLDAGEERTLYLGVRRDAMSYVPTGTNGAEYQSILEVSAPADGLITRVPVRATDDAGITTGTEPHHESEGLWVGQARLDGVNAPAYSSTNILETPAPCNVRFLLHIDGEGRANLLQQVFLAWDATLTDPPHTNGAYGLFTSADALPSDATEVRQISCAAFPPMAPLPLSEAYAVDRSLVIDIEDTACVKDQENYNFGYYMYGWTFWQSFTAGADGQLAAVRAVVYARAGGDWTGVLSIHEGTGLSGALLATRAIAGADGVQEQYFLLDAPVAVTNGGVYTYSITNVSVELAHRGSHDYYAGGACNWSGYDFNFSTYLLAPRIPGTLAGLIAIAPDHPLNPYLHRYNPQHDNLNWSYDPYSGPVEVPSITRDITLTFAELDESAATDPYWGEERTVGIYTETITGLRAQPIITQGPFVLDRISKIGALQSD
ncbi:MAG: hypothetical protein EOM20_11875 [Spartobacteria bacterium]|nr:hypothetical protein [Spartobacteria bacterium]